MIDLLRIWASIIGAFFGLIFLLAGIGCNNPFFPEPAHTKFSYSPVFGASFEDTKDNDIDMTLSYEKETGIYTGHAVVRNNASDANKSIEPLMKEYTEQMKQTNEALRIHGENLVRLQAGVSQQMQTLAGMLTTLGGQVTQIMQYRGADGTLIRAAAGNPSQPMNPVPAN